MEKYDVVVAADVVVAVAVVTTMPPPTIVETTAISTPFRRWMNRRAREEKSNSTLALAQASELIPIFSCPLDSNTYLELF